MTISEKLLKCEEPKKLMGVIQLQLSKMVFLVSVKYGALSRKNGIISRIIKVIFKVVGHNAFAEEKCFLPSKLEIDQKGCE